MENSGKLVDFILEKEQREKAKRKRRLMIGGSVAGLFVVGLALYIGLRHQMGFVATIWQA